MGRSCKPTHTVVLAQNAMMYHAPTLLLAAVIITGMASGADSPAGPARGCRVTRFVCSHCTSACQLSSSCLFLGSPAPHFHFKPCFTSGQGFQEIQVEARNCDIMAPFPQSRMPASIEKSIKASCLSDIKAGGGGGCRAGTGRQTPATRSGSAAVTEFIH